MGSEKEKDINNKNKELEREAERLEIRLEMEKQTISFEGDVRIKLTEIMIHNINKESFDKLKKIGVYESSADIEWVEYGGVTFFKQR